MSYQRRENHSKDHKYDKSKRHHLFQKGPKKQFNNWNNPTYGNQLEQSNGSDGSIELPSLDHDTHVYFRNLGEAIEKTIQENDQESQDILVERAYDEMKGKEFAVVAKASTASIQKLLTLSKGAHLRQFMEGCSPEYLEHKKVSNLV
jgi:hypothetical protein